ncbi:hypothetical protein D8B24_21150, partial [Verminephrobacter aporrectodeae subsp. tuberculatae]|uniref:SwmB domain-containing protein n=1 Tax=Verminephrobacter aporrectodeae TaxID=1110389 RepID=UPI002242CBA5
MAITSVSIQSVKSKLRKGEWTLVDFWFNETPLASSFNLADDCTTPTGTHLSGLTKDSSNPRRYWATLSVNDDVEITGRISINLANVKDPSGYWGSGTFQSNWISIDTLNPRVRSITLDDTSLKAGETTRVRFVFSEIVTVESVRAAIDLSNAHGTLDGFYIEGGNTWIAIFTPAANTANAEGCRIGLNVSQVRDTHGNAGQDSSRGSNPVYSSSYTVSTLPPSLAADAITFSNSMLSLVATTSVVTLTFSEPVKGLSSASLQLPSALAPGVRGTLSAPVAQSPDADGHSAVWTATLTAPGMSSTDNVQGNKITVNLAGVTDRDGIQATTDRVESSNTYAIDVLKAYADFTMSDTNLGIGEVATVTVHFNEKVTGFTLDDIRMNRRADNTYWTATMSDLVNTDDRQTWTFRLTPDPDSEGQAGFYLHADSVTDLAGNPSPNTSSASTASYSVDHTRPALASATVNGSQLVLTYTEANTLDAAALAGNAGFAVSSAAGTPAITVNSAVVNGAAKTVTLTLSRAVAHAETVRVSYTKPATGAVVQDAAGNDAANFSDQAVTNNTPADTTPPQLITTGDTTRPKVTGDQLVLSFSGTGNLDADPIHKPAGGAFTVLVNGVANAVTTVTVDARAKTVTLTLSTAVSHGQSVTVAYTDPTTGNDTNAIQDVAGNDVASFAATAVTNNTPAPADTTPPQLITTGDTTRPKVSGDQLVLSFSDTGNLDGDPIHKPASGAFTVLVNGVANAVTTVTVQSRAKTVTLTLSTAVTHGQSVTVAYTDPTTGNDTNAIQDVAGNDAASFAATEVTNNTPAPPDTTAPQLIITGDTTRPKVNGDQLVLSFSDTGNLDADATHKPANGAFTVLVNGVANAVTNVSVEAQAKTVTLTLSTAVTHGQTVTVAYADPTTGNDTNAIQDTAGNDAASFAATAVTNNTPAPPDTTPPELITTGDTTRPKVTGDQLVLSFSDTGNLDADATHKPANGAFTVLVNGVANAVTNVSVEAQAKTVTLTLSTAVTHGQTVTVAYA